MKINWKEFKPYSLKKACKKFRYPFSRIEVEPTGPYKDSIQSRADAASYNLTFWFLHGFFMFIWYLIVMAIWIYYLIFYSIRWFFSSIKPNLLEFIRSRRNGIREDTNTSNNNSDNTQNVSDDSISKTMPTVENTTNTFNSSSVYTNNSLLEPSSSSNNNTVITDEQVSDTVSDSVIQQIEATNEIISELNYETNSVISPSETNNAVNEFKNEYKSEPLIIESNNPIITDNLTENTVTAPIVQQVEETSENINEFIDETTPADTISEAVVSENEYVTEPINYETTDTVIANEQTADTVTAPIVPQVEEIRKTVSESSYTQPVEPPKPVAPINRPVQNNYQRTVENNQFRNNNSFPYERNTEPKPVTQPNYQSNYENNQNTTNGLYTQYSQPKKSPVVPILCGVIGVLIVGGGILGGMLLMKNKNNNNSIQQDESVSDNEGNISEQVTTTEAHIQETNNSASDEEIKKSSEAYLKVLSDFTKTEDYNESSEYGLYDIDSDGIYELIIGYNTMVGNAQKLYQYSNGKYLEIASCSESSFEICSDKKLVQWYGYGGYTVRKILEISKQGNSLDEYIDENSALFTINGIGVNQSDFNEKIQNLDSLSWKKPQMHLISDIVDSNTGISNNSDPYLDLKKKIMLSVDNELYQGKDSHIENAPSDMTIYDIDKILESKTFKNALLLEGPKTTYPIIRDYYGVSEKFDIVGENIESYYVRFIEGSGKFTHPVYGYIVKKEAVIVDDSIDKYTTYDTSAAPNNFSFNNEPYDRVVATEKDDLNLRSAPSSSADVIITMPKGSKISLWGSNSEWAYVSYSAGGKTYYGYAGAKYISVAGVNNSSDVYSVEKYGTIYSPTGAKIDGFTTSYVVNNGAVSYERHDLTHGWHIKAVRQYTSGGITWYELYDADDGDYYGWVDSNFISFY